MRGVYAHEAIVSMTAGEAAAVGGAVTGALCGSWDHPPPCPLAAHSTSTAPCPDGVVVRVLFATDAARELEVRARIEAALAGGAQRGPDGTVSTWIPVTSGASAASPAEREHGERLAREGLYGDGIPDGDG
jgi:hypothetical protein